MLIQFSVSNFTSFKDEVLLNMIPAKSRTMKDHIISDDNGKSIEVLPLATIYGANASGKTNLVKAISFMKNIVLSGTRPDMVTGVISHKLDPHAEQNPARFEIVFKHDGVLYTYGFVISSLIVQEEWLFAYYTSQESTLFERLTTVGKTDVYPGKRLIDDVKGSEFIKFISKGTRPNQLFLTEAHEKNIEILKPVVHWFREHLHIISPNTAYTSLTVRAHADNSFIDYISKFLHIADTGINQIRCESEEFDSNKHLNDFPEDFREQVINDLNSKDFKNLFIQTPFTSLTILKENLAKSSSLKLLRLKTEHIRTDGASALFDTSDESDGTRRLMELAPMLLDIWERDRVFVIDELDRSLHTHLSKLFIQTCLAGVIDKKARGQFIMTTHDTNLLDRSLLRKDEILFMEKDRAGASHLTSLAEYKVSEGLNYENGYLNGRFGAIPYVGNVQELLK